MEQQSTRERLAAMREASRVVAPTIADLTSGQVLAVVAGFLLVLAVVAVAWPLLAFVCLNWIGGFGLSFAQIVGIGWFAGAIANQS